MKIISILLIIWSASGLVMPLLNALVMHIWASKSMLKPFSWHLVVFAPITVFMLIVVLIMGPHRIFGD